MNRIELHPWGVKEYFETARERYRIFLRRRAGEPPPWTSDSAMAYWRFCNVFREDDATTVWIRENVREPMRSDPNVVTAMTACRFINRPSSLERWLAAGVLRQWDHEKARESLAGVIPVIGGGYLIKTPTGKNKLDGVCEIVGSVHRLQAELLKGHDGTLRTFWENLRKIPFVGPFMAYEIVSDLRHTDLLQKAPDAMTWANAGPGACAGLSWLCSRDLVSVKYSQTLSWQQATQNAMRELLVQSQQPDNWPSEWPAWQMREVEHWLCEYAKWVKVTHLGWRMKRRY